MKIKLLFILITYVFLVSCGSGSDKKQKEIIIFHAGSLSVPFKKVAAEYEKRNPDVKIMMESAGSLVCARKVTELKKPCDIIASSDYFVITEMLIPGYTDWSIRFATNEIVIAYLEKSRHSYEINSSNWIDILEKPDVVYGRSDPDSDPCGYRTVFAFKLAEKYYNLPGLTEKMISKNVEYIRPKEVDLVALLESNSIDYMFQYKSVAIQHNLKYIELPAEINLGDILKNDNYKTVSLEVAGSTPGSKMTVTGDYINYSLTILNNAPDKKEALDFVDFLLSPEGTGIMNSCGQKPIKPINSGQADKVPAKLLKYLKD